MTGVPFWTFGHSASNWHLLCIREHWLSPTFRNALWDTFSALQSGPAILAQHSDVPTKWGLGREAEGSRFPPRRGQNMEGAFPDYRPPSEHCWGAFEQSPKPTNAQIGSWDEPVVQKKKTTQEENYRVHYIGHRAWFRTQLLF